VTGALYRSIVEQLCHLRMWSGKSTSMRWPATEVNTMSQSFPSTLYPNSHIGLNCELRGMVAVTQCERAGAGESCGRAHQPLEERALPLLRIRDTSFATLGFSPTLRAEKRGMGAASGTTGKHGTLPQVSHRHQRVAQQ
jgi:hypothetical protein